MEAHEIFWHDSLLRKVVELTASKKLLFEVDYPVDWEAGEFVPHTIGFEDVYTYEIHEGPCVGPPTLLAATASEKDKYGTRAIRIETTSGFRIVRCKDISLKEGVIQG